MTTESAEPSDSTALSDSTGRGVAEALGLAAGDALAGLKVLDLSWVVAGPLVTRALADFGAVVVRVESSSRIETARLMQPFHGGEPDPEGSALFGNCNAGKLGVTLDLGTRQGQEVVLDLARWADVVVESFSPGRLDKWGLGYEHLRTVNPGLVMLSTSLAGQSGPWSSLAGYGNVGSSLSGFQNLVGYEDRLPVGTFGPYTDYLGPRLALTTLLAAIEHHRITGEGAYIDASQVEAGIYFLSPQVAHYEVDGSVAQRNGDRDAQYVPNVVLACRPEDGRDRFVAVTAGNDTQFRALAEVAGRHDLADRADLSEASGRRAAEDDIEVALRAWAATMDAAEVESQLQRVGVPAYLAVSSDDYALDTQLAHRGHLVRLAHPRFGTTTVEAPRYRLSRTPGRPRRAAPSLGQDNELVLREILGYGQDHIATLTEDGVLQ